MNPYEPPQPIESQHCRAIFCCERCYSGWCCIRAYYVGIVLGVVAATAGYWLADLIMKGR
jgi:hypothetical protein